MGEPYYRVEIDKQASGPDVEVPWSPTPVPNPTVMRFQGPFENSYLEAPPLLPTTTLTLRVGRHGSLEVSEVTVRAADGQIVTGAALRALRFGLLVDLAGRILINERDVNDWYLVNEVPPKDVPLEKDPIFAFLPELDQDSEEPRATQAWVDGLRALGPSHPHTMRSMAALQQAALAAGKAPVQYIADLTQMPPSTVSHWMKLARQAGIVAPSGRKPRSVRGA